MKTCLDHALARWQFNGPVAIALSGGADSTALLLACWQRWPAQVAAIHVHHGLQDAADGFASFCQQLCQQCCIPLHIERVDARHQPGQSPEDAARKARYGALTAGAQALRQVHAVDVRSIALAQHADDQVETLLLALSRGAGLPGLSAMPAFWQRNHLDWHRPLLDVPGQALRQWLQGQGQAWIEDPTNEDQTFTRNRIRQQIMPALAEAFPTFRHTFARSSAHAAQAQQLLHEVAQEDWLRLEQKPSIRGLQQLSIARQANVLRFWLMQQQERASTVQLQELQRQIAACTTRGHAIHIKVGRGFVIREKDHLLWVK
ncbi:tRNA lysidine(34) synthetase TilS [Lampropedia puyangensis]|uniref:tRNA(Ile)-lysidine synthase n=1 Tax=Lampropedia puyangensis TaxID=1330072 RepID=A0A4S8EQG4_9BURK|nr:tRNA lysidine(34) synthetase TilS [Lampropedia puyangensis]THT96448.1 tRNA lysidine(34) synthetase TilS [Lampropedia puyangensis]